MTTNRADLLEPALAARPAHVDQAIELPLPDADSRSRLIELFCAGLDTSLQNRYGMVAPTDGVSPGFLRELVRKAPLFAARSAVPPVDDRHFAQALDLLESGGRITRTMLGGDGGRAASGLPDDDEDGW